MNFIVWLIIILGLIPLSELQAKWKWSNPDPHGNNISEIGYSDALGLAVQVCDRGQIYISSDLKNWRQIDTGYTNALRAVTFFNSKIIVTGENGLILYSEDGENYYPAQLSPATTDWFEGVAAGRINYNSTMTQVVVAVGDNGSIYSSFDGTNWVKRTQPYTNWLRGVCFGNRSGNPIIAAVGENGTILTSQNLVNWTKVTAITTQHLNRIGFTNGNFYAVGEGGVALIGANGGNSWTPETTGATNSLNALAFGLQNTRLYVGNNEVRYFNGISWINYLAPALLNKPAAWNYTSALSLQNLFLIGGMTGMLYEGYKTNSNIYWNPSASSVRQWLWDITSGSGFYVCVGNNGSLMTSSDGVNWELELVPLSATNSVLLGISGDTNMMVAVGSQGAVLYSTNEYLPELITNYVGTNILITTNYVSGLGVIWNAAPRFNTNTFQGVCKWHNQFYISGDNGLIFSSANGTNWTRITTPTTNSLSGLAGSSNAIVAVGAKGTILFSSNGNNWSSVNSGTTNWLYKVRYLNTNYIIVGNTGTIMTSADGLNWTPRNSGTTKWLTDVTYLNGVYYVVGLQGIVLISTDLINWRPMQTISGKSLYGIATLDGQIVACGIEGIILRNQVAPSSSPVNIIKYSQSINKTNGIVYHLFLFGGKTDQIFRLNSTTNIATQIWETSGNIEITDKSGFLYYFEYEYLTNRPFSEFFRTQLIY
ncbi:MAG: hypothetical protein ACP5K7_00720 [Verrucomicrobiia bacterium]